MQPDPSDHHQLNALLTEGVAMLPDVALRELADVLETRAVETGLAAPLFVSQAIRSVIGLMADHDSAGGVRLGFLHQLDSVLRPMLRDIQRGDPLSATRRARELRDSVRTSILQYDPRKTYE